MMNLKHLYKLVNLILLLSICTNAFSQEESLSPLIYNNQLTKLKPTLRTFPAIFIYEIDTLDLPFLDEFSRDKFKSYNAQPGDANVTEQKYYRLYDQAGSTKLDDTVKYMKNQTYYIVYDTLPDGSPIITQTPLDSIYITINDLTAYPIQSEVDSVWPRYNILDTAYLPSSPDTIWLSTWDYQQDSVSVYFVSSVGDNSLWQDRYAYRNNRYPIGPPTIGVATFDGLNEFGYPYDFVNITLSGICDYLTSKPIRLKTKPNMTFYTAADSLYLSFYYQSTGRGNSPEVGDSLYLEFWAPDSLKWFPVWSVPGSPLTDFKQVMIPIKSFFYLKDGFKFRFKNQGNLSGSLDHWHIDYVYLNSSRTIGDTIKQDVAFVYDALTLLKEYSQMPWNHFLWDPSGYMADTLSVYQKNNDNVSRIVANQQINIEFQGVPQATISGPLVPSVSPNTFFSTLYDIDASGFVYDTSLADTCAAFDVRVTFNPGSNFQQNDTIEFTQEFKNVYAYDDGTAEAAYGPQGANAYLAYRFFIPQSDTLRAIQIHFEPNVNNVTNKPFFLNVWDASGPGGTPGNVITQNTSFLYPIYVNENNGFYEYPLDNKVVLSGNYYVGWRQLNTDKLNIGFDLNTNKQSKIYYNTSGSWINTSFQGALMMRPVFAYGKDYVQSITELEQNNVNIYPNPANDYLQFESAVPIFRCEIYDLSGRKIVDNQLNNQNQLQLSFINDGMYVLRLYDSNQQLIATKKLIIRH